MILKRGAHTLTLHPHGAAITSLTVDGMETLLQPQGLSQAEGDGRYLNRLVGRVANRIAHGCVPVDDAVHVVSINEHGNTLHGGEIGWSMRDWTMEETAEGVRFTYVSPDGEMGFPGEVKATADIAFVTEDAFEIRYGAVANRPTPVNLTHHLYFNLSGQAGSTILDHALTLVADSITACGEGLIPTGDLIGVDGTPFDFRAGRTLGQAMARRHPQLDLAGGIDHNFVLAEAWPVLTLRSPTSGVTLEIETDQPGIQIYAGQKMKAPWVPHQALAIEPQDFPDAVNNPTFPNTILRPGKAYSRRVLYRLFRS